MSIVPRTSLNGQAVLIVGDVDNPEGVVELLADEGYLITAQAVWDPDTNEWVPMVQPTIEATISGAEINIEPEKVYNDSKIEYDSDGNAIYAGENEVMNASESATDWVLYKMYYDVSGNTTQIKSRVGSWESRTASWE
jgi:hypothetical protein